MSSRDKATEPSTSKMLSTSVPATRPQKSAPSSSSSKQQTGAVFASTKGASKQRPSPSASKTTIARRAANRKPQASTSSRRDPKPAGTEEAQEVEEINEMATTSLLQAEQDDYAPVVAVEQETNLDGSNKRPTTQSGEDEDENTDLLTGLSTSDSSTISHNSTKNDDLTTRGPSTSGQILPAGWEQHSDSGGLYYWHVNTGVIQRDRPMSELVPRRKESLVIYHDDEEINMAQKISSDDEDYYESGAALTLDDTSESTFVVYPLGCCEFDETQLVSATSSKAIQKCILRLSNKPTREESVCWGLDQQSPILMKLFDDHIQFIELKTNSLLRSQPIQTIKTWAVDDDNNFAFVVEDRTDTEASLDGTDLADPIDYALLNEPSFMCYVFRSIDDDTMSFKVAAKLHEEINRYREQMSLRITRSTRLQQMIHPQPTNDEQADAEDFDDLEASNELTMNVKYIGKASVPRPTGIDILNVAIDKCLAEASKARSAQQSTGSVGQGKPVQSPLLDAKLHVSPSSVIVESVLTGEIIVECRIRYLTFMGISRRDIRWCGFMMQNPTSKTFEAHCFECHPTAGHVCEAIQTACTKMFEKVMKSSARRQPETMSIIPTGSKIRTTLAKTFSRIKLNPIS